MSIIFDPSDTWRAFPVLPWTPTDQLNVIFTNWSFVDDPVTPFTEPGAQPASAVEAGPEAVRAQMATLSVAADAPSQPNDVMAWTATGPPPPSQVVA